MTNFAPTIDGLPETLRGNSMRTAPCETLLLDVSAGSSRLHVETDHGGQAMPAAIYNGLTRRYVLLIGAAPIDKSALRDALAIGGWLNQAIDTVQTGLSRVWDGRNFAGRLDDDATEANDEIERRIRPDSGFLFEAPR